MIVLGFDTSTSATAVGLRLADGSTLQAHDCPAPSERPGHATRLLPLAEQMLAQAGLGWDSLQRLAVGVGPGTFTGLRVGISTARGLAQSLSLELVRVGSLHALAHQALQDPSRSPRRRVLAAIDARRGEAFIAGWSAAGELFAPRALAPEGFEDLLLHQAERSALDRHDEPPLAVGDGAIRYRSQLERLGVEVPPDSSPLHIPTGVAVCELALHADPCPPAEVLPDYLRRPDAEIALQGATG